VTRQWAHRSCVILIVCASCSAPAPPMDAGDVPATDAVIDSAALDVTATDARPLRDAAAIDRADVATAPRCYGIASTQGLLQHVGSIPRDSWASSNGASGCVGDVDNDGRREFILLRMNEPSELIGADLCSRGRVLLPDFARDCVIADVDGAPGNELVVLSSVGWTAESFVTVGRVRPSTTMDQRLEPYVFADSARLDDRRPVSPIGAPHIAITDLDGDRSPELAVSGNYPAAFARVWQRSGAQPWTPVFAQDLVTVMDDSHGWLVGDADGDGTPEALLLTNCSAGGQHWIRRFDRWSSDASHDTPVSGPVHAALAELDGVAPRELVTIERVHCNERRPIPSTALRVRRWDSATRQFAPIASLVAERPPNELVYVAAMDVVGTDAHEIIQCSSPVGAPSFPRTCRAFSFDAGRSPALRPEPSQEAPFTWVSPARRVVLSSVLVDDLDGDGARELFLMGQDHVDVLRGPRR
jgi:hypothetical protein